MNVVNQSARRPTVRPESFSPPHRSQFRPSQCVIAIGRAFRLKWSSIRSHDQSRFRFDRQNQTPFRQDFVV
ncbi:Uncharacterized protein APZ42_012450 [Daphnia magna]|uniref:Uncharacterized protein n=1 Tax=Daphnia magna TaxID=35525 RepID=A0A162RTV9_9CRUS|nr:Uncharacterized protein APZ42_012450 [Daphnia magna]